MPLVKTLLNRPVTVRAKGQDWSFNYSREHDGHVCQVHDTEAAAQLVSASTYEYVGVEKPAVQVPPRRDVAEASVRGNPLPPPGTPPRRDASTQQPAPAAQPKAVPARRNAPPAKTPGEHKDPAKATKETEGDPERELPKIDLEQISGVTDVLKLKLENRSLTAHDIAKWTPAEIAEIEPDLGIAAGTIERQGWVPQAQALVGEAMKAQAGDSNEGRQQA